MNDKISLGYLLSNSARLTKWDITNRMYALGMTFPQWMVLKDINNHEKDGSSELSMAAIARRLNSNRPNIMGMIDRLEKLDLVARAVNPNNRRSHIITLTNKAKDVMHKLQEFSQHTTDKALQGFDQDEAAAIRDYLTRIITNLTTEG